jgi:hypothetical protein
VVEARCGLTADRRLETAVSGVLPAGGHDRVEVRCATSFALLERRGSGKKAVDWVIGNENGVLCGLLTATRAEVICCKNLLHFPCCATADSRAHCPRPTPLDPSCQPVSKRTGQMQPPWPWPVARARTVDGSTTHRPISATTYCLYISQYATPHAVLGYSGTRARRNCQLPAHRDAGTGAARVLGS